MPGTASSTKTAAADTTVVIPPEAYEAFAIHMRATGDVNFLDWFNGEGGQAAISALADQQQAAARSQRLADVRAVSRDIRDNGQVTTYSRDRAIALRDYLSTVDFDAITDAS